MPGRHLRCVLCIVCGLLCIAPAQPRQAQCDTLATTYSDMLHIITVLLLCWLPQVPRNKVTTPVRDEEGILRACVMKQEFAVAAHSLSDASVVRLSGELRDNRRVAQLWVESVQCRTYCVKCVWLVARPTRLTAKVCMVQRSRAAPFAQGC